MNVNDDPGLVLYLPLHEKDGTPLAARGNRGQLCTVHGAPWQPDGRSFDGLDDWIDCGDCGSPDLAAVTVIVWVRAGKAGDQEIAAKVLTSSPWTGYCLRYLSGSLSFSVYNTAWNGVTAAKSLSLFDGSWHYLAGTYDGTAVRLCVDGALQDTKSLSGVVGNTQPLRLGYDTPNWLGGYFQGVIGEVFIYHRALAVPEIEHTFLATKWRYR